MIAIKMHVNVSRIVLYIKFLELVYNGPLRNVNNNNKTEVANIDKESVLGRFFVSKLSTFVSRYGLVNAEYYR